MAREAKPGKFEYSLEAVLKVRTIWERQEKEKFGLAQKKFFEEHEKTQKLIHEQEQRREDLVQTYKKGKIDDFGAVLRRQVHLENLGQRKEKQVEVEKDAEKKRDDQRETLVDKMKDRKIIDKDKEHRKDDHKNLMDHLESNFFDEIGTNRFILNKLDSPEE